MIETEAKETTSILVIESPPNGGAPNVSRMLSSSSEFRCETKTWELLDPENLRHYRADLVVPVFHLHPERLTKFFERSRREALPVSVLAVMPGDVDAKLLELASETTQDFVLCPLRPSELYERVRRLVGSPRCTSRETRRRLASEVGLAQLVGQDETFVEMLVRLPKIAACEVPVLVTGETGTGKELLARAIHLLSPRCGGPFVPVDCTAIPEHLLESELFGHMRGAFTDACRDQKGLTALATGGTLFLDEIDALSLAGQAKLLRLLQEGTYRALGSQRFEEANVRVIAATNQDLETCVREKRFRSDLYFRLNVISLRMPPLRERRGDVELLARHFLRSLCMRNGGIPRIFSLAAMRKLESYDWPGNIRELFNVVQRAVVLCTAQRILPSHIALPANHEMHADYLGSFREARARAVTAFERNYVTQMLSHHGGNITHAAQEAKKDRRAFGRLVKKHRIVRAAGGA